MQNYWGWWWWGWWLSLTNEERDTYTCFFSMVWLNVYEEEEEELTSELFRKTGRFIFCHRRRRHRHRRSIRERESGERVVVVWMMLWHRHNDVRDHMVRGGHHHQCCCCCLFIYWIIFFLIFWIYWNFWNFSFRFCFLMKFFNFSFFM